MITNCLVCKKSFSIKLSQIKQSKSGNFCGRKCYSEFKKGKRPPNFASLAQKARIASLGKKLSKEHRRKISEASKGRNGVAIAFKRVMAEIPELEKQGFRCIPVDHKITPDIIGIKDGKVYAIEIEYRNPNYEKYNEETKKYYDDVIWIIRKIHRKWRGKTWGK